MADPFRIKLSLPNSTGVVGETAGYLVANETQLRVAQRGVGGGYITLVQAKLINDTTWTTLATLTGDVLSSAIDISAYDLLRFNVNTAGSTGDLYISSFFPKALPESGGGNSFETIQTDAGTNPVASSDTDILTLTSSDGSITITGDSTTDTVNLVANLTSSSGIVPITHGGTGAITESDARANLGVSVTSLYSGCIGVNNGATFTIPSGLGYIVSQTLLQVEPTHVEVSITGVSNIAPLYTVGVIYANSSGTILQQNSVTTPVTAAFKKQNIVLYAYNVVLGVIVGFLAERSTPISTAGKLEDLMEAIGPLNVSGNIYSAAGANLILNKSAGITFQIKSNIAISLEVRDTTTDVAATPLIDANTFYGYRNGTGGFSYAVYTGVTPNLWDDGTGTPATVSNNKYTVQRIYFFNTSAIAILYLGQAEYSSLANAGAGVTTEIRVVDPLTGGATFRASLVVKKGTTSLQNASDAAFYESSKFGNPGTASSSSVPTLQVSYNNSTTPEITTNATLGAFSLMVGSGADTDLVFETKNTAGTTKLSIDGNGKLTSGRAATDTGFELNKTITSTGAGYTFSVGEGGDKFLTVKDNYLELRQVGTTNTIGAGVTGAILGTTNIIDAALLNNIIIGSGNSMLEQGDSAMFGSSNIMYATGSSVLGYSNTIGGTGNGDYSLFVLGISNTTSTQASVTLGVSNINNGFEGAVVGTDNKLAMNQSAIMGYSNNHSAGGSPQYTFGASNSGSGGVIVGKSCMSSNASAFACGINLESAASKAVVIGAGSSSNLKNTIANSLLMGSGGANPSISFINNNTSFFNDAHGGMVNLQTAPTTTELLTNPNFTGNATSWTLGSGITYNVNNVICAAGAASNLDQTITTEVGIYYYISYVLGSVTAGSVTASFSTTSNSGHARSANGTFVECFRANGVSEVFRIRKDASFVGTIDTVQVKRIDTGNFSIMGTAYVNNMVHVDAKNETYGTTTGTKLGTATGEKIAFHNSTPVIQRVGAAQVAVATTAATNVAPYGFTTAAQADAIITLVNELRAALVEKGLIKGAA